MKTYLVSLGNSNDGAVGAVLEIRATSRAAAYIVARQMVNHPDDPYVQGSGQTNMQGDRLVEIRFFVNEENISLDDVEEG